MKQSSNNSQHTSQSHSTINNLSIFTKNPSHLQRSNSNISSDKMITNPILQSPSAITSNRKGYNFIEWLILIFSIFSSYLSKLGAVFTVFVTRHFYILEFVLDSNFYDKQSILETIKLYSIGLIVVIVVCFIIKTFSQESQSAKEISHQIHKSVNDFLILLTMCFFLLFTAKQSVKNKSLVDKTFAKTSHFIAWFVLGSTSAFGGYLFGAIFSTKVFRIFGETIILVTHLMALSSILSIVFEWNIDGFDLIQ